MAAQDTLSKIDRLLASAKEIQLQQHAGPPPSAFAGHAGTEEQPARARRQELPRRPSAPAKAGEELHFELKEDIPPATADHLIAQHIQSLASLRSDIELMIRNEGRRSFWNGFWTNAIFFVLGLVCAAVPLSSGDVFAFFRR